MQKGATKTIGVEMEENGIVEQEYKEIELNALREIPRRTSESQLDNSIKGTHRIRGVNVPFLPDESIEVHLIAPAKAAKCTATPLLTSYRNVPLGQAL